MYGKLFQQLYKGSMVGKGAHVFAVWGYCIAEADPIEHTVSLNPPLLSAILGEPVEKIEKAIEFLCSPDENSRCQDHEGRRLVQKAGFSYFVVTHAYYRAVGTRADLAASSPSALPGYVYFLQAGTTGEVKIGYSKNPWARAKDLQVGNPEEVKILGTIRGDMEVEAQIHGLFKQYRTKGEWFKPSKEIFEYIKSNASVAGGVATHVATRASASASDYVSASDKGEYEGDGVDLWAKIAACPGSGMTLEGFLELLRMFPKADAEKAVQAATMAFHNGGISSSLYGYLKRLLSDSDKAAALEDPDKEGVV